MENKELHENFLKDFKELLRKYDACFEVFFETEGWYHKDVPVITFEYNNERGIVEDLRLHNYIDGYEN